MQWCTMYFTILWYWQIIFLWEHSAKIWCDGAPKIVKYYQKSLYVLKNLLLTKCEVFLLFHNVASYVGGLVGESFAKKSFPWNSTTKLLTLETTKKHSRGIYKYSSQLTILKFYFLRHHVYINTSNSIFI